MKLRNKKTGEIVDVYSVNNLGNSIRINTTGHSFVFESLEKLNGFFEDYISAEPLIKLPDIRKALRAWAYVQRIKEVRYVEGIASSDFRHLFEYGGRGSNRGVIHWGKGVLLSGLEDGKTYTIAELCGEEEECES
jgi:hypothetical protein